MSEAFKDLKVSARQLGRTPGFTASAVLVLALGIGLNAGMFGLMYSLAFAGRPFHEPDRIAQLYSRNPKEPDAWRTFSYMSWEAIAARGDVFDGVLAHNLTLVGVSDGAPGTEARRGFGALVSGNYFDVLGVRLAQGRGFTAEENRPGAEIPVAIASHALWQRTGFDPGFVGRTVRVNERPFTIVGIAPRGFTGTMMLFGPEVFFPFGVFDSLTNDFDGPSRRTLLRPDALNLFLVGRLKPGVTPESARPALLAASADVQQRYPVEFKDQEFSVRPLPRFGTSTSPMDESAITAFSGVMLGMTGAVLLVVCLNLATMMLARGHARRREFAVRLALGGGRARIVRQLLIEGLMLALGGGVLGVLLGLFALDGLVAQLTARLPITLAIEIATRPTIVAGAALFSLAATLLFSLGPALRNSGANLLLDLKQQGGLEPRSVRSRFLPKNPLVTAQIALSLALLVSAGLFVQMARLGANVDSGLDADETVVAEVDASLAGYDETRGLAAYRAIEERLGALPGVRSAAVGVVLPFGTVSLGHSVRRAGTAAPAGSQPARPEDGREFGGSWNAVGAGYFDAMGIRSLSGRVFRDSETLHSGAPPVAILNERLARELFPGESAIGRSVEIVPGSGSSEAPRPLEVVGVVSGIRDQVFDKEPGGALYVPFAQAYRGNVHFHVRPSSGPGAALLPAVRQAIAQAAPGMPLFGVRTFSQHFDSSLEMWGLRVMSAFFIGMGFAALAVALVGIYGVKSWAVSRRSREIGVRLAIGATPAGVRSMILREGLHLGAVGALFGLGLGALMGRLLDSMFVDLDAFDPATFTLAPLLLLAGVLFASWFPARRATAVDPATTLRAD